MVQNPFHTLPLPRQALLLRVLQLTCVQQLLVYSEIGEQSIYIANMLSELSLHLLEKRKSFNKPAVLNQWSRTRNPGLIRPVNCLKLQAQQSPCYSEWWSHTKLLNIASEAPQEAFAGRLAGIENGPIDLSGCLAPSKAICMQCQLQGPQGL